MAPESADDTNSNTAGRTTEFAEVSVVIFHDFTL